MLPAAASQGSFFLQRQEGTLGRVAGSVEGASLVFASPSMALTPLVRQGWPVRSHDPVAIE